MRCMRITAPALLALGLTACASFGRVGGAPTYDLLITGGRIVDGTGNPWYYGDVAVTGDRIAAVGHLAGARAKRTIDARGLVVAPGFIDMLGHSEYAILDDPRAVSKITQGITSEITGEVNSAWPNTTPAPDDDERQGRRDPWTSLDGYFRYLEKKGSAINLGTYVAAGSVRRAVMGDASRRPTADEMQRMEDLVDRAMRDGAMGFSTGLIYTPSTFFTTDELVALTRRAAAYGGGYASHIRSEGDSLLPAIREAIAIGHGAGTWIEIRHLKASQERNWGKMAAAIALIDSARRAGIDVTADQYPYTASGTGLTSILPTWVLAGGTDSMVARLRDSTVRLRLREAGGEWRTRRPESVLINTVRADSLKKYEGIRLDSVGKLRGQDPYEAAYDILIADRGATSAIYFTMSEDDVRLAMRQPWVSVGQDAGARTPDSSGRGRDHPRAFGTFPRILGRYVREDSVIPLEFAVRKMTSLAAQRVGLDERGVLKRGMYADVTVFDPATVLDRSTYELPQQIATGIRYVLVNGRLALADGTPTGVLAGRALRGPGRLRIRR